MIQMQKELTTVKAGMEEFIVDCKIRNLKQDTINYYNESFDYFVYYINITYDNLNVKRDITKKT